MSCTGHRNADFKMKEMEKKKKKKRQRESKKNERNLKKVEGSGIRVEQINEEKEKYRRHVGLHMRRKRINKEELE